MVELDAWLQQALLQPLLAYCDIEDFRHNMADSFQKSPNLQYSALFLGAQSATPGMAFLSGYQSALRCLDPKCPNDHFAAFCVSEKGVKKPWDMETKLKQSGPDYFLNGRKGFVMLLPHVIDRLYVVAKCEDNSLSCVQLPANTVGLSIAESLNAPFIQDIPHAGIVFDDVVISANDVLTDKAHQQANKPFRYWEDVHVAIAMAGWMLRQLIATSGFETDKSSSLKLICQLIANFERHPNYYSLEILDILDDFHQQLDVLSKNLPEAAFNIWQKDRLLLQMGYKTRHQIRFKFTQ
jgi:hypothetical protein